MAVSAHIALQRTWTSTIDAQPEPWPHLFRLSKVGGVPPGAQCAQRNTKGRALQSMVLILRQEACGLSVNSLALDVKKSAFMSAPKKEEKGSIRPEIQIMCVLENEE